MNKKIAILGHRKVAESDKHIIKDVNNIFENFIINNQQFKQYPK